jgi:hypothetical protein
VALRGVSGSEVPGGLNLLSPFQFLSIEKPPLPRPEVGLRQAVGRRFPEGFPDRNGGRSGVAFAVIRPIGPEMQTLAINFP